MAVNFLKNEYYTYNIMCRFFKKGHLLLRNHTRENSPKEEHGKVAYVALQLGNVIIGGDDAPEADIKQLSSGNMLSIGEMPDSKKEADRIFKGLAVGSKSITEMTDYPWGYIGSVLDKYGVNWGVWYQPPRQA